MEEEGSLAVDALEKLSGSVDAWKKLAKEIDDGTGGASICSQRAQQFKWCAHQIEFTLPALREQVEQARADAIFAAADISDESEKEPYVLEMGDVGNRIRSLTPVSARLRGELRVMDYKSYPLEVLNAKIGYFTLAEFEDWIKQELSKMNAARAAKRAEIEASERT
jgi:hypothetical protein